MCGALIRTNSSTTNLRNHLVSRHKVVYMANFVTGMSEPLLSVPGAPPKAGITTQFSATKRSGLNRSLVQWMVKCNRPLSLPFDPEFRTLVKNLSNGGYSVPNCHQIDACILELSAEGSASLLAVNTQLAKDGVMPCISGDIWSETGKALLGICQHFITGMRAMIPLYFCYATPHYTSPLLHFTSHMVWYGCVLTQWVLC